MSKDATLSLGPVRMGLRGKNHDQQVTRELADGTYLREGMKFSMTGWWEIKLAIDAAAGADTVVFNTVVERPAVP